MNPGQKFRVVSADQLSDVDPPLELAAFKFLEMPVFIGVYRDVATENYPTKLIPCVILAIADTAGHLWTFDCAMCVQV